MTSTSTSTSTTAPAPAATSGAPQSGLRWPTARVWFDLAVLTVLAAVGVLGFEPAFGGYGFLLAGLGGLLVGTATGIVTAAFRLGPILTAVAAVVAYFLFGTAFAVPQLGIAGVLPTLNSLVNIAFGSVFGWADLVTLATPVGAPQYIAVVPYAAAWIVAIIGSTLARDIGSMDQEQAQLAINASNRRFIGIGRAYGWHAEMVSDLDSLRAALLEASERGEPSMIVFGDAVRDEAVKVATGA